MTAFTYRSGTLFVEDLSLQALATRFGADRTS